MAKSASKVFMLQCSEEEEEQKEQAKKIKFKGISECAPMGNYSEIKKRIKNGLKNMQGRQEGNDYSRRKTHVGLSGG